MTREYSREYIIKVVRLIVDQGLSITEVSLRTGVDEAMIWQWMKELEDAGDIEFVSIDSESKVQWSVTAKDVSDFTVDKLYEMLAELENAPKPEAVLGAMCYMQMAPPNRVDYICPVCGKKTVHVQSEDKDWMFIEYLLDVENCRREIQVIPESFEFTLGLDESEFCAHCSPNVHVPKLALIITYRDGRSFRTSPIKRDDIRMLGAFLRKGYDYSTVRDDVHPLKDSIPRLRELLGLSE